MRFKIKCLRFYLHILNKNHENSNRELMNHNENTLSITEKIAILTYSPLFIFYVKSGISQNPKKPLNHFIRPIVVFKPFLINIPTRVCHALFQIKYKKNFNSLSTPSDLHYTTPTFPQNV